LRQWAHAARFARPRYANFVNSRQSSLAALTL
jgi:hypothetical protein